MMTQKRRFILAKNLLCWSEVAEKMSIFTIPYLDTSGGLW